MLPLRNEVQTYSKVCEAFLSPGLEPDLNQDEQDVIVYYANQLFQKFDHHRIGEA